MRETELKREPATEDPPARLPNAEVLPKREMPEDVAKVERPVAEVPVVERPNDVPSE
jgi:hypothetical protein